MKILAIGMTALLVAGAAIAYGQVWGPYYDGYHASTAAEGYANGVANVARSQGMRNLLNSQAAINMTEAQRKEMENRQQWTDTYFQMRQANKQYRAEERGPQTTMEQAVRFAQAGKPEPLSPSELDTVDGGISWPVFLKTPAFAQDRETLDALFAKRAKLGGLTAEDYIEIDRTTQQLLDTLKSQVKTIPPAQYVSARNFIQSLAYEGTRKPG